MTRRRPEPVTRPPVSAREFCIAHGFLLREAGYLASIRALVPVDSLQAAREPAERLYTADSCDDAVRRYQPGPRRSAKSVEQPPFAPLKPQGFPWAGRLPGRA